MKIAGLILLTAVSALHANTNREEFEICTTEGMCALMVYESRGEMIFVVKEDSVGLRELWQGGQFIIANEVEYQEVRSTLPEDTVILPHVVPQGGDETRAKQGTLISGSVTVGNITIGGNENCTKCHTAPYDKIHKQMPKPKGGAL